MRSNGVACSVATSEPPSHSSALAIDSHSDGAYAVFTFRLACPSTVRSLEIEYRLFASSDPTHRGILRLVEAGSEASRSAVLDPGAAPRSFALSATSPIDTLREFVVEGIWHIWMGFDHILFLLALLLTSVLVPVVGVNQRIAWQGVPKLSTAALDMLKIVTAFTVAHSITLALAVLDLVTLPSRPRPQLGACPRQVQQR